MCMGISGEKIPELHRRACFLSGKINIYTHFPPIHSYKGHTSATNKNA